MANQRVLKQSHKKKCNSKEISFSGIVGNIIHGEEDQINFEEEETQTPTEEEEEVMLPSCHGVSSGDSEIVFPGSDQRTSDSEE